MAKTESIYDLSETEKRDLIKLIEQGRPLPEKYRFLLFADKREVELVWNGKSREVCTAILPFQTLEHIDEPRKEKRDDEELGLDTGGRQVKGWTNKLIWGDNKLITCRPPVSRPRSSSSRFSFLGSSMCSRVWKGRMAVQTSRVLPFQTSSTSRLSAKRRKRYFSGSGLPCLISSVRSRFSAAVRS